MATEEPPGKGVPQEPSRRLFFALWPDDAMRQAMAQATRQAARASGGRLVPVGNLHITLAFLGSVSERRLPELAEVTRAAANLPASGFSGAHAASSSGECLELVFDHLEYWRAAHLLCALPTEAPAPVGALARKLQELLVASGFAPDLKPFRPHVTVARKVAHPAVAGAVHPVAWRFTELSLIESRTLPEGALYSVVNAQPLASNEPL